ncbi:MAG TPA: hypothetical protein VH088_18020 [Terriglobales bacterium]|jgi:hypothetical protein|nr:hypothetical protein [Terriglobales bacterium]
MKFLPLMAAVFLSSSLLAGQNSDVASMERKLQHMKANAEATPVDSSPTEFSEQEINAYMASGRVHLPEGVLGVKFHGDPGVITATAHVDFDQLKTGRSSLNPLLSVFNGIHDMVVVAHAQGGGHEGLVRVDTVTLDGVEIPRFVLQSFVEKFLQPKYPYVGLDSRFGLKEKIDTATVGDQKLTVTQK